jgi:hypothetical protein
MPSTRTRTRRGRTIGPDGLDEVTYTFFSFGPFFEAENFADGKSKEELRALWKKHHGAIEERYCRENPTRPFDPWTAWRR